MTCCNNCFLRQSTTEIRLGERISESYSSGGGGHTTRIRDASVRWRVRGRQRRCS